MEIIEREAPGVVIAELKITAPARGQYDALQQLVRERMAAGSRYFVFNLSGCAWIDSSGLGELIKALVHVMRQGGNLKLAAVPHKVKGILAVTNLTQVFEIYESEVEAIASFAH